MYSLFEQWHVSTSFLLRGMLSKLAPCLAVLLLLIALQGTSPMPINLNIGDSFTHLLLIQVDIRRP
jgi:hypothetical protein